MNDHILKDLLGLDAANLVESIKDVHTEHRLRQELLDETNTMSKRRYIIKRFAWREKFRSIMEDN